MSAPFRCPSPVFLFHLAISPCLCYDKQKEKGKGAIPMLDKEDLHAIQTMIDTSVTASEQRMSAKIDDVEQRMSAKIDTVSQDTMRGAAVLMEQYFDPKFNILSENIQLILEKLDAMSTLEPRVRKLEEELPAVKAVVRANRQDIDKLKEAM